MPCFPVATASAFICTFLLVEGVSPTASVANVQRAPGENTQIGAYCESSRPRMKSLDPETQRVHLVHVRGQRERWAALCKFLLIFNRIGFRSSSPGGANGSRTATARSLKVTGGG